MRGLFSRERGEILRLPEFSRDCDELLLPLALLGESSRPDEAASRLLEAEELELVFEFRRRERPLPPSLRILIEGNIQLLKIR